MKQPKVGDWVQYAGYREAFYIGEVIEVATSDAIRVESGGKEVTLYQADILAVRPRPESA